MVIWPNLLITRNFFTFIFNNWFYYYKNQQIYYCFLFTHSTHTMYKFLPIFALLSIQINTNEYIKLNYLTNIPIQLLDNGTCSVSIPCETKIGGCSIQYSLLPYDWASNSNGTLLLPVADTKKSSGYPIKATLTNIFGDKIEADLVGIFKNNYLTITDRNQFFKSNGFNLKQTQSKPLQMPKINQPKKNYNIQGFPTISEIQNLIKTGNIYTVSTKLKDISDKYGPCKDKLNYLNQILQIIQNKIENNQNNINKFDTQTNNLKQTIAELQNEKKLFENKINSDKQIRDINARIKNLTAVQKELSNNYTRLDFLASNYLKNMNQLSTKPYLSNEKQIKQDTQIAKMQDQVKKLQQIIKQAMQKKKALQQKIKQKKQQIKKQTQPQPSSSPSSPAKQSQLMKTYQQKYHQYSNQALNIKINLIGTQQQIKKQQKNITYISQIQHKQIKKQPKQNKNQIVNNRNLHQKNNNNKQITIRYLNWQLKICRIRSTY